MDLSKIILGIAIALFPIWNIVPGDEALIAVTLPVGLGMLADGVDSETAKEAVN